MKTYSEIDVEETPIVVLGCGHFFTAESLDGLVGINEVYNTNTLGEFTGLADISSSLAMKIPKCPDCKRPIMQYITQRYNRVINRAVIDEMSKRFLVNGKSELLTLEKEVETLEVDLGQSREDSKDSTENVLSKMRTRYHESKKLQRKIEVFLRNVADRHQPARKLHEAIVYASRKVTMAGTGSLADMLDRLSLGQDNILPIERDRRVTFGGRTVQIKAERIVLEDKLRIMTKLNSDPSTEGAKFPGGDAATLTKVFMKACASLMKDCVAEELPKLAVEAAIHFATTARVYSAFKRGPTEYVEEAKELLNQAHKLCDKPFQNADKLKMCVEDHMEFLGRAWYEEVTAEELAEIKNAMVSGRGGIATHSGHWYNCARGHPVGTFINAWASGKLTLCPVCYRRMWNANAACALSRMR